jgi:hypothetical protein
VAIGLQIVSTLAQLFDSWRKQTQDNDETSRTVSCQHHSLSLSRQSNIPIPFVLDCMMGSIVKSALPLPVQISLQMNLCNCQFNGTYEEQKSSLERWQWLCQLDLMIIASLSTSIGAASSAKHARYSTQAGTWQVHVESCCSSSVEWLGGLQITDTPPQWTNWMFV